MCAKRPHCTHSRTLKPPSVDLQHTLQRVPEIVRTWFKIGVIEDEWVCSVCCHHNGKEAQKQEGADEPGKVQAIKESKRISRPSNKLKESQFESMKSKMTDPSAISAKTEINCSICNLSGGAMSRISVEGEDFWVHETCRIWTDGSLGSRDAPCILCGVGANCVESTRLAPSRRYSPLCVVKCAAPGCHISVHPMCALASTLISQSTNNGSHEASENVTLDNIKRAKKTDEELCSQYTLTFASIRGLAHSFGKDPGARCATTLPIFFCGIHNPAREQSYRGLYPGGGFIDAEQILKVPSC